MGYCIVVVSLLLQSMITSLNVLCVIFALFFYLPPNSGLSDTIILDIISNYLVLPNRITVPLVSEVQIAQLRFPIPKVSMSQPRLHLHTDSHDFLDL